MDVSVDYGSSKITCLIRKDGKIRELEFPQPTEMVGSRGTVKELPTTVCIKLDSKPDERRRFECIAREPNGGSGEIVFSGPKGLLYQDGTVRERFQGLTQRVAPTTHDQNVLRLKCLKAPLVPVFQQLREQEGPDNAEVQLSIRRLIVGHPTQSDTQTTNTYRELGTNVARENGLSPEGVIGGSEALGSAAWCIDNGLLIGTGIVVDVGDSTTDIGTYHHDSITKVSRLVEHETGKAVGGGTIGWHFRQYVKENYASVEDKTLNEGLHPTSLFERRKQSFGREKEDWEDFLVTVGAHQVLVTRTMMVEWFDTLFEAISELIDEHYHMATSKRTSVSCIILLGGPAKSPYLVRKFQANLTYGKLVQKVPDKLRLQSNFAVASGLLSDTAGAMIGQNCNSYIGLLYDDIPEASEKSPKDEPDERVKRVVIRINQGDPIPTADSFCWLESEQEFEPLGDSFEISGSIWSASSDKYLKRKPKVVFPGLPQDTQILTLDKEYPPSEVRHEGEVVGKVPKDVLGKRKWSLENPIYYLQQLMSTGTHLILSMHVYLHGKPPPTLLEKQSFTRDFLVGHGDFFPIEAKLPLLNDCFYAQGNQALSLQSLKSTPRPSSKRKGQESISNCRDKKRCLSLKERRLDALYTGMTTLRFGERKLPKGDVPIPDRPTPTLTECGIHNFMQCILPTFLKKRKGSQVCTGIVVRNEATGAETGLTVCPEDIHEHTLVPSLLGKLGNGDAVLPITCGIGMAAIIVANRESGRFQIFQSSIAATSHPVELHKWAMPLFDWFKGQLGNQSKKEEIEPEVVKNRSARIRDDVFLWLLGHMAPYDETAGRARNSPKRVWTLLYNALEEHAKLQVGPVDFGGLNDHW